MRSWGLTEWQAFADARGVQLRRCGSSLRGCCPFHGGRNPTSFSVTPGVAYHCFSCGAAGDLRRLDHLPEPDDAYRRTSGRGCARETKPFFGLDASHPYLAGRGVEPTLAKEFGIGYFHGSGAFARRIIIPVHGADGTLVGHLGRSVDESIPRYRVQRGTPKGSILFNRHRVKCSEPLIVVEGAFDVLAVRAVGVTNVVALLGARATPAQVRLLRRFPSITILFDADDAGRDGARNLHRALGVQASILDLPHDDPASHPPVALRRLIEAHPA